MKKIILIIILGILLSYMIPGIPSYTEEGIKLYVNGHHLSLDHKPVIEDGRTLVPVRRVLTTLGAVISWDSETRSITCEFPECIIKLTIDNPTAVVNGQNHIMEVAPRIIENKSYMPIRFIAESLDAQVSWDGDNQIVHIDSDRINYHGEYKVKKVVDGDTIVVHYKGDEETVRLIGIDTPESVHPDQERNTESGEVAAGFTRKLLDGAYVGIQLDIQERDQYGRLLAYVWFEGKLFNRMLLEEGMAAVSTYPPNVMYEDILMEAQEKARMNRRGFWDNIF
ncbi:stalk domain-containing protein [Gudongella sp. DL1XJH-153]|uniref:stalk domain-containing protein n=1 Tax=Gudongella sp. DL1XJH-153 TaxID=3409804 RepID=UPI003BB491FD